MTLFRCRSVRGRIVGRARLTLLVAPSLMALAAAMLLGVAQQPFVQAAEDSTGAFTVSVPDKNELAAPGDCRIEVDHRAAPDPVVRGAPLDLILSVRAVCEPSAPIPLHLVLVVDSSAAAADPVGREIKDGLRELVQWFDPNAEANRLLGVVAFADTGQSVCELTADPSQVLSCIEALGGAGGAAPETGLAEALAQFKRGRSASQDRDNLREIVLLVQAGIAANECAPALEAASALKGEGVLSMSACVGATCNVSCMRQIASSARYFFVIVENWAQLRQVVERVRDDAVTPRPWGVTVTDTLPANMVYRAGSAVPPAETVDRRLEWSVQMLPPEGITFTLQVTPIEVGRWPTGDARAIVAFRDGRQPISAVFPIPVVNVLPEHRNFLPIVRSVRPSP